MEVANPQHSISKNQTDATTASGMAIRAAVRQALRELVTLLLAWKRSYPQLCELQNTAPVEREEVEGNNEKTTVVFYYCKGQHTNGAYMAPNECCLKLAVCIFRVDTTDDEESWLYPGLERQWQLFGPPLCDSDHEQGDHSNTTMDNRDDRVPMRQQTPFRCAVWYSVQAHEMAHSFQSHMEQTMSRCLCNLMENLSFEEMNPTSETSEDSSTSSLGSNDTSNEPEEEGKDLGEMRVCA